MGAYKKRTGKTRVGNGLSKIGGFFSNIFKKKTPSNSTNSGTTPTVIPKGATQPISGNPQGSSSFLEEFATFLGTAGLAFLGTKIPSSDNPNVTVAEQQQIKAQNQEDAKNAGSGIIVVIGGVILAVIAFLYFRSRK